MKKVFIHDAINNILKTTFADDVFIYEGILLHIRKDYVYLGDKEKMWIITDYSGGFRFCEGETILQTFIYLDLLLNEYSKDEINERRDRLKIRHFDEQVKQIL